MHRLHRSGNFATNIAAGAKYGYLLLWVVVASSLMAMVIQTLSAKLGIATGKNLPEVCRDHFSHRTSSLLWIQAEVIAMATDLAEFLGAAIGFNLLIGHEPLRLVHHHGGRRVRAALAPAVRLPAVRGGDRDVPGPIGALLPDRDLLRQPDASGVASGLVPPFDGSESVLLAVGILGATVMPHVIYLHSALTQDRIVPENERTPGC